MPKTKEEKREYMRNYYKNNKERYKNQYEGKKEYYQRKSKERYRKKKDEILKYYKTYLIKPETIERRNEQVYCKLCDTSVKRCGISIHKKTKKHLNNVYLDKIQKKYNY